MPYGHAQGQHHGPPRSAWEAAAVAPPGAADDTITVTELPGPGDAAGPALFGRVLGSYEQHGFEAGYRRAVRDVLVGLLATTESFVREQPPPTPAAARDLWRVVFAFERYLERRAGNPPGGPGFVEGGLGI